jgi:hypothetical protein
MAAPASAVTISRAAEILGEDEELLWDMADDMEPEDGCLWIHDTDDQQTIAFTPAGLEYLREMLPEYKRNRSPPRCRRNPLRQLVKLHALELRDDCSNLRVCRRQLSCAWIASSISANSRILARGRTRSSRNGGRHHLGTVGGIIPERGAASPGIGSARDIKDASR